MQHREVACMRKFTTSHCTDFQQLSEIIFFQSVSKTTKEIDSQSLFNELSNMMWTGNMFTAQTIPQSTFGLQETAIGDNGKIIGGISNCTCPKALDDTTNKAAVNQVYPFHIFCAYCFFPISLCQDCNFSCFSPCIYIWIRLKDLRIMIAKYPGKAPKKKLWISRNILTLKTGLLQVVSIFLFVAFQLENFSLNNIVFACFVVDFLENTCFF